MTEPGTETTTDSTTDPGTDPTSQTGEEQDAGLQPAAEQAAAEHVAAEQPAAAEPAREPTGDAAVDEALEEFDRVTGAPLDTHIEVAERVHRKLQNRLTDLGNA